MIRRYQQEMAGLNQQRIVAHEHLAEEVTVTTYADGTRVYVNYSNADYRQGSLKIPARDYLVKGGSN